MGRVYYTNLRSQDAALFVALFPDQTSAMDRDIDVDYLNELFKSAGNKDLWLTRDPVTKKWSILNKRPVPFFIATAGRLDYFPLRLNYEGTTSANIHPLNLNEYVLVKTDADIDLLEGLMADAVDCEEWNKANFIQVMRKAVQTAPHFVCHYGSRYSYSTGGSTYYANAGKQLRPLLKFRSLVGLPPELKERAQQSEEAMVLAYNTLPLHNKPLKYDLMFPSKPAATATTLTTGGETYVVTDVQMTFANCTNLSTAVPTLEKEKAEVTLTHGGLPVWLPPGRFFTRVHEDDFELFCYVFRGITWGGKDAVTADTLRRYVGRSGFLWIYFDGGRTVTYHNADRPYAGTGDPHAFFPFMCNEDGSKNENVAIHSFPGVQKTFFKLSPEDRKMAERYVPELSTMRKDAEYFRVDAINKCGYCSTEGSYETLGRKQRRFAEILEKPEAKTQGVVAADGTVTLKAGQTHQLPNGVSVSFSPLAAPGPSATAAIATQSPAEQMPVGTKVLLCFEAAESFLPSYVKSLKWAGNTDFDASSLREVFRNRGYPLLYICRQSDGRFFIATVGDNETSTARSLKTCEFVNNRWVLPAPKQAETALSLAESMPLGSKVIVSQVCICRSASDKFFYTKVDRENEGEAAKLDSYIVSDGKWVKAEPNKTAAFSQSGNVCPAKIMPNQSKALVGVKDVDAFLPQGHGELYWVDYSRFTAKSLKQVIRDNYVTEHLYICRDHEGNFFWSESADAKNCKQYPRVEFLGSMWVNMSGCLAKDMPNHSRYLLHRPFAPAFAPESDIGLKWLHSATAFTSHSLTEAFTQAKGAPLWICRDNGGKFYYTLKETDGCKELPVSTYAGGVWTVIPVVQTPPIQTEGSLFTSLADMPKHSAVRVFSEGDITVMLPEKGSGLKWRCGDALNQKSLKDRCANTPVTLFRNGNGDFTWSDRGWYDHDGLKYRLQADGTRRATAKNYLIDELRAGSYVLVRREDLEAFVGVSDAEFKFHNGSNVNAEQISSRMDSLGVNELWMHLNRSGFTFFVKESEIVEGRSKYAIKDGKYVDWKASKPPVDVNATVTWNAVGGTTLAGGVAATTVQSALKEVAEQADVVGSTAGASTVASNNSSTCFAGGELNGLRFVSHWDASLGVFPSGANGGDTFRVSVAGTVDGTTFAVGDLIVATATSASTAVFADNWTKVAALPADVNVDVNLPVSVRINTSGDSDMALSREDQQFIAQAIAAAVKAKATTEQAGPSKVGSALGTAGRGVLNAAAYMTVQPIKKMANPVWQVVRYGFAVTSLLAAIWGVVYTGAVVYQDGLPIRFGRDAEVAKPEAPAAVAPVSQDSETALSEVSPSDSQD